MVTVLTQEQEPSGQADAQTWAFPERAASLN